MSWSVRIATLSNGVRLFPSAYAGWDFTRGIYRIGNQQTRNVSALPGYNFTRALAAYAEDTAGNLIQFASGVPRITNKGVLIEESRTNLLQQSQTFGATWSATNSTITENQVSAPDGTLTADKINDTADGSSLEHFVFQSTTPSSSTVYTYSVYAKYGSGNRSLAIRAAPSAWASAQVGFFDLSSGTVLGVSGGGSASIQPLGNGWYRCVLTTIATSSATATVFRVQLASGTTLDYTGTGNGFNYIWGAQLEAGSFPTSYIPTTSASVTRPADVFYYALASDFTTADFSIASQAQAVAAQSGKFPAVWAVNDGSVNNELQNYLNGGSSATGGTIKLLTSGVARFESAPSGAPVSGAITEATSKAATVRASAQGNAASLRGSWTNFGSPATSLVLGKNDVPSSGAAGYLLNGYIQRLASYPFAASDAQLQSISSGNF